MADKWDLDTLDPVLRQDAAEFLNQDYSAEDELSVGFEVEFGLLMEDEDGYQMVDGQVRDDLLKELNEGLDEDEQYFDKELGSWVIEADIGPLTQIDGLRDIDNAIQEVQNELVDAANRYNVDQNQIWDEAGDYANITVMRYGSLPVAPLQEIELTEGKRYRMLPEEHAAKELLESGMFSPEDFQNIDPVTALAPAGITGFQTNIQAFDREDAIRKNRLADQAQTYVDAAMGNSGIINYEDTGFNDVRVPIWQMNFNNSDSPNKVGPWESYPKSLEEYAAGQEISLPIEEYIPDGRDSVDSFNDVANSEKWKTSRIKREGDVLVVESRLPPIQQSPSHDAQVAGFILGHTHYHQNNELNGLNADQVKHNYESAVRNGMGGKMITSEGLVGDTRDVFLHELEKAKRGLYDLGIDEQGYLEGLEERTKTGMTPGEEIIGEYRALLDDGQNEAEAMKEVLPKAFYRSV